MKDAIERRRWWGDRIVWWSWVIGAALASGAWQQCIVAL
jgi:hypothetical protein